MPSGIQYPASLKEYHSKRFGLRSYLHYCALFLCGLLATYLLFVATQRGMGISSDSIAYIGVSEHIVTGKGLSWISGDGSLQPMTHFPPLYPLLLAVIQITGMSSIEAAGLINLLAFGVNVIMIGWIIFRLSGSYVASILGSLLAAISPIMISWHSMAMTEPIFITFLLLGMGLLSKYFKQKRLILLVIVGIIFGLHYLTRYAGLSIIIASAIAIFLSRTLNYKEKVQSISLFLFVSITPTLLWMVRNRYVADTFTNRRILWHPPSVSKLKHAFAVFWKWIFPYEFTYAALYGLIFCLLLSIVILVVYLRRTGILALKKSIHEMLGNHLLMVLIAYGMSYVFIILATMTFFDASTPMDTRIALPLYIVFLILVPTGLAWFYQQKKSAYRCIITIVVGGLLSISYIDQSYDLIGRIRFQPRGYGSETKQQFSNIDQITELPSDIVIFTNNIEGLYFQFNKYGHRTPISLDYVTAISRPQYEQELSQMREMLSKDEAILVLFHTQMRGFPSEWTDDLELYWQQSGIALYAAKGFYDRFP